jgi:DNA-binding response OmpR family regulator
MKILLVEDDIKLGKATKELLTYENCFVDWAEDGIEALSAIQYNTNECYDVILLDWMLPEISGIEICKLLRSKYNYQGGIIFVTAKGELDDCIRALNTGADDFIVKPYKIKELLARINAVNRRKNKPYIDKIYNKNNIEVNSVQTSSNISLLNNFNNSVVNINNKVMSKNFNSPIKTNINNFLTNMNDEKRDKINMIKFLSKPRTMNVYFQQKKYTYLFFLSPNNLSYINAIETYIFKFVDMKNRKPIGGFDLIKVDLCSLNNNNPNFFYVRTNDGKIQRNYEFEASSQENAIRYVQSINYLVQLEKCKIYNNKNIFL